MQFVSEKINRVHHTLINSNGFQELLMRRDEAFKKNSMNMIERKT